MKVRIKKLREDAVIPSYAKAGDAGLDLTAVEVDESNPDYIRYHTGLAVEIPEGFVGLLFARSSNCKMDVLLANSVGVIDSGYRGEVDVRFKRIMNANGTSKGYKAGERIAQLVIIPHPVIELLVSEELSDSERGEGGYGSSGK